MIEKVIDFLIQKVPSTIFFLRESRWEFLLSSSPIVIGLLIQLVVVGFIILLVYKGKETKLGIVVSMFFDQMYEFFEEIVGEKERRSIKIYIITLFFVIFTANIISYLIDLIRVVFNDIDAIYKYIQIPTTDFNFNIALAVVSVVLMLFIQLKSLNPIKFILEYIPITGKGILDIDRGNMLSWQYYPIKFIVKIFDIVISLFVGLLDIVGIGAKILSLSARLYGNMLAGGILLGLLIAGVNNLTQSITSADFPILAPLILYAQGLLVAVIQAFVFPLLVAIFIKIAQGED